MRFIILLLFCSTTYAESVTLIPNTSNSNYSPSANQLVTIGIPFSPCELTNLADFRLLNENNVEVPVFVKETLYWPNTKSCGIKSTRAIKVQFVMNATAGQKVYSWNLAGRNTASDLIERPVSEVPSSIPNRAGYNEPAVFGILPPAYLVQTELTPPTTPANANVFDQSYYPAKFDYAVVNGVSFTSPRAQDWLLDTTSTIYKQAIRRNEVEQYRQAYLNHEFYVDHIVTTLRYGSSSCPGGWGLKSTDYCIDAKLIYTEPQKLHIALTGDDTWLPPATSQIGNTLHDVINAQADLLFTGSKRTVYKNSGSVYPAGFRTPYDDRSDLYTERHAGIGLISILNACEITHAAAPCAAVNTAIDNIYDHNLDTNNVWDTPYTGYQKHSWMRHENVQAPWVGIIDSVRDNNTIVVRDTIGDPADIVPGTSITTRSVFTTTGAIYESGGKFYVPVAHGVGDTVVGSTPVYVGSTFIGRARSVAGNADVFEIYKSSATAANSTYSRYPAGTVLTITQVNLTATAITVNADSTWTVDIEQSTGALEVGEDVLVARNTIFPDSDEAFSPWMSSILMDGLWQFYHWSDDAARKQKAATVILGLARATIAFSIDARTTQAGTVTAIENAFSDWPTAAGIDIISGINDYEYADDAPLSRYAASYWMTTPAATSEYINSISEGGYQKQHLPELMHAMALGMFFETDPAKKAAMGLVAKQAEIWFDEYRNTVSRGAIRSFPWQLRSDPYGTWQFVRSVDNGSVVTPLPTIPPPAPPPLAPPPFAPPPPASSPPPASPPLAGNTSTQAGSSSINNLDVSRGNNVVNQGRIYNLTNAGTVSGGILGGVISNRGTLQNVTLDRGTILRGGLIKGALLGNGTVTDALLDVTNIGEGIVLGANVRITSATARSVPGLDLSASAMDLAGHIDLDAELVDGEASDITLRDITLEAVNAYFRNSSSDASSTPDGPVNITNPGLPGIEVSLLPAFVSTTAIPNGVMMSDNGELQMIDDGVLVNFLPVAHDQSAINEGLADIGAALSEYGSGLMRVNYAGINFSFRFSPMVQAATGNSVAGNAGAVVFKGNGYGRYPAYHRIVAWYPDGRSQELLPYLHDMEALRNWMESAGLNYRISATASVIRVLNAAGIVVWKGVPDYKLMSADAGTVGVEFSDIGDLNGDGISDKYFSTEAKAQVVYGLPL